MYYSARDSIAEAVKSYINSSSTPDRDNNCSEQEAIDKLQIAFGKSKGRCNNALALQIAFRKDSTADDIIRLGQFAGTVAPSERVVYKRTRKLDATDRAYVQRIRRDTPLGESVIGKFLKAKGMWDRAVQKGLNRYSADQLTNARNSSATWRERRELNMLMFMAKMKADRFKELAPHWVTGWVDKLNIGTNAEASVDERRDSQQAILKYEMDALEQADEHILSEVETYINGNSGNPCPNSFGSSYWATWNSGQQAIYYNELGRMFIEALQYMGLGIYHNIADLTAGYQNRSQLPSNRKKGTIPIAKKTVAMLKSFNSMLKKGFEPSIVREEIIAQLNEYAAAQKGLRWVFFARLDAPSEYEIKPPKKEKSAKAGGGEKCSRHVAHTETIEGLGEVRF